MKQTSFSVIVPTFNVQDYVIKALDSIFVQDYENVEVIIVDDASMDNTVQKIENYIALQKSHNQHIKFIKCEVNRGLSTVREEGLKYAQNEWILFLDSDDWYNDGLFKELNRVIQNNSDINIIEFNFDFINEYTQRKKIAYSDRGVSSIRKSAEENIMTAVAVWNKCFRKSFLENINLPPIPRTVLDDAPFTICALLAAKYFYWLDFIGYSYIERNNSLSKQASMYFRVFHSIVFMEKELKRLKIYDKTQFEVISICLLSYNLHRYSDSLEYKNFYNECRKFFHSFDLEKNIKTPITYNRKIYKRVLLYPYWLFKLRVKISKSIRRLRKTVLNFLKKLVKNHIKSSQ
ncbi:MAG: glycosyltransferase [Campylobacteraceae bacterium]|jgi:glycosyltransferase involved in cell wall biosynthesis|nr:glycosyltransferase [Campylobacteraceae bacterium]